jgi:Lrp/AsnC family leucine-responsive transcriptional regulator
LPGVKDSRSYIVMETCKEGQELDIKSLTDRVVS